MSTPIDYTFPSTQFAPSMATPSSTLLNDLVTVIEQKTMMLFGVDRRTHFVNTVTTRARATGESSVDSYIRRVLAIGGDAELMKLIDDLTINETTFFRNVPQLELVTKM